MKPKATENEPLYDLAALTQTAGDEAATWSNFDHMQFTTAAPPAATSQYPHDTVSYNNERPVLIPRAAYLAPATSCSGGPLDLSEVMPRDNEIQQHVEHRFTKEYVPQYQWSGSR